MKLTNTTIRTLALPSQLKEKTFFCDDLPGFGVRVRAGGSQTYVLQYKLGTKHRRFNLGATATLDLGKARDSAKDLLAKVRLGADPAADKAAKREKVSETFGKLLPRYLKRKRDLTKPRSYQEIERHLSNHCHSLHSRAVDSIDRRAIALLLQKIEQQRGPAAANNVRASLSGYFVWLCCESVVEANPVQYTNEAVEQGERKRVLTDAELVKIWNATDEGQYGAIVKLLILTGARRNELADLRHSEVETKQALITLPGGRDGRTKNKREFVIPLSKPALAVLKPWLTKDERDHVFGYGARGWQDWSGSKRDLDQRCGVTDWVLHDFRRTVSTTMHEKLGIEPHIVEAVLNHVSGHKAGVAGTYNRAEYMQQKRDALNKWSAHVSKAIKKTTR